MKEKMQKGFSFGFILFIIIVLGVFIYVATPSYPSGRDILRWRVSELILAGSSAKTALSEGYQEQHSWSAKWMSSITISATGMISSATIGPTGQIVVYGTAPTSFSVVTMTPTTTDDYKLVWTCTGKPQKYMPASCR